VCLSPSLGFRISDEQGSVVLDPSLHQQLEPADVTIISALTNGCSGVICLLKKADSWKATVATAGSLVKKLRFPIVSYSMTGP